MLFCFSEVLILTFTHDVLESIWCINTLSLKRRNIRKYVNTVFLNSKIRKNRSFSVWTSLLTAIFWTFSPAFIFSSAVKERWGLSRTESVLIFKIGKREPLDDRCALIHKRLKGNTPNYVNELLVTNSNMHMKNISYFDLNLLCPRYNQEYPTKPLDKIPALQAEFELAGKKNIG